MFGTAFTVMAVRGAADDFAEGFQRQLPKVIKKMGKEGGEEVLETTSRRSRKAAEILDGDVCANPCWKHKMIRDRVDVEGREGISYSREVVEVTLPGGAKFPSPIDAVLDHPGTYLHGPVHDIEMLRDPDLDGDRLFHTSNLAIVPFKVREGVTETTSPAPPSIEMGSPWRGYVMMFTYCLQTDKQIN